MRQADQMHGRVASEAAADMVAAPLVTDSVAEAELAECLAKARFLTDARSGTDRSSQRGPSLVRPL